MPKIKIAILATSLVPPHPAGTQILEIIDQLSDDFEFTVFAREIDKRLTNKVTFIKVPTPLGKPLLLRYIIQFFLYSRLFRKLKLDRNYDIVHSIEAVSPYASLVTMQYCGEAAKALMRNGTVQYKGWRQLYYKVLLYWGTKMENRLVRNKYIKGIIVPSKGLQADVLRHHHKTPEITIIPNGVDLDRFKNVKSFRREMRTELQIGENEFVGIIAGLGDWERKGLGVLIEAMALLGANSHVKIIVIGKGNIDHYKNLCRKKGIQSSFIFIGITHELEKYYGLSDFFILPTANEACSVVTLMAAASGLPVLATKVNGVEDFIIEGKSGFFIKREASDIAEKIRLLMAGGIDLNEVRRNSSQHAGSFDIKHVSQFYADYYRSFISRN